MQIYTHKNDKTIRLTIRKNYGSTVSCNVLSDDGNYTKLESHPLGLFPVTQVCKLKNLIQITS